MKSGRSCSSTVNKNSSILNRQNSTCTQCQTPINSTTLTNSISGHNHQKAGDHISDTGLFSLNSTTNTGSLMSCNDRPSRDNITNNSLITFNQNGKFLKSMLFDTYLEFNEFQQLFKSFYIHMRKDLKEIFDRYAILVNSKNTDDQNIDRTWQSTRKNWKNLIYANHQHQKQDQTTKTESTKAANNDLLITFTRNNLTEELPIINSFKNFFNTTMPTTKIRTNSMQTNKELYKSLMFQLQNQIVNVNNNRLFFDLIASNSISPYSVNCSSDLLLLNYFSQVNSQCSSTQSINSSTQSTSDKVPQSNQGNIFVIIKPLGK